MFFRFISFGRRYLTDCLSARYVSIRPSMLSQPSSHLLRRNTILLELLFSVFAFGSRSQTVYEQQMLQTLPFCSAGVLQSMLFSDHYYLSLLTTLPNSWGGYAFMSDHTPFLCDQGSVWNEVSREKYIDPSLATPTSSHCCIAFREDERESLRRNSTRFT